MTRQLSAGWLSLPTNHFGIGFPLLPTVHWLARHIGSLKQRTHFCLSASNPVELVIVCVCVHKKHTHCDFGLSAVPATTLANYSGYRGTLTVRLYTITRPYESLPRALSGEGGYLQRAECCLEVA